MIYNIFMSISICPLGSGSKGNSTLVKCGETVGLIDAGLPFYQLKSRLESIGVLPDALSFIVLTHEHDDHIAALSELATAYDVPVYANEETMRAARLKKEIPLKNAMEIGETPFFIGALEFEPVKVSHDAANPYGYSINDGYTRISYATDLGVMTDKIFGDFCDSSLVMIESNHDKEMLFGGRYPEYLKRRIWGGKGHLSNDICAETAVRFAEKGVKRIVLSHLSEENNLPELAYYTTAAALRAVGATSEDVTVRVAKQRSVTGFIEV